MNVLTKTALLLFGFALFPATAPAQTCNTADRSVFLILDASGSMNARLPNGETRFAVAQRAIKGVASFVPAEAQLALRLYGAQSPAKAKNCEDAHRAVPFDAAAKAAGDIASVVDGTTAQGYTPIALSLERAAGDFPPDAKERVIVLVSDGKETCKGDPTVAAKALAGKGITVHTVGFIVDSAARMQLQNIARATGGTYFDAPVGPELPETLKSAFDACKKMVVKLPAKPKPGKLRTTSATSHAVFDSETGKKVGTLDAATHQIDLPAGVYEVQFGPSRWKGIEVRPGETTEIAPGVLRVNNIEAGRLVIVDAETGEKHGDLNRASQQTTVMPGLYNLSFGSSGLIWPFVKIDGGNTTTLSLARVVLHRDLKWEKARVLDGAGKVVARFDAVTTRVALPPGDYVVEVDGNKIPFAASNGGEALELTPE
jgi:hypothetical protein